AYNTTLAGDDLRFQFSLTDGTIARSSVNYASAVIDADFDNSGTVDGRDLLLWQRNLGTNAGATNGQGDSDANGAVNAADLANWRSRFGDPSAVAAASAIPEPSAAVLMLCSAAAVFSLRQRRRLGADAVR
ncbi:MAG TPA: dockerin type I domain-containing protein, partial [Lacipirellula sp.]